jgi:hypothetical protein
LRAIRLVVERAQIARTLAGWTITHMRSTFSPPRG